MKKMRRVKVGPWILLALVLALILIYFCLHTAALTLLFPIYPDEVAERVILSRMGYDFPLKFSLLPMCHYLPFHHPVIWYFPAFFEWLFHGRIENLKIFRLTGALTSVSDPASPFLLNHADLASSI